LLNALEVAGKDIGKVRVVVNGAGAAGTEAGARRLYPDLLVPGYILPLFKSHFDVRSLG
jgi:hypothetical protein